MEKLELKRSDREELERRARSRMVRAEDARRAVRATARAGTIRSDSRHGSSYLEVDLAQADRWIDALDDPKAGKKARDQSYAGGDGVEASKPEDSSDRTLHGFERS